MIQPIRGSNAVSITFNEKPTRTKASDKAKNPLNIYVGNMTTRVESVIYKQLKSQFTQKLHYNNIKFVALNFTIVFNTNSDVTTSNTFHRNPRVH